jgi:DNA-binding NtrC family response regulator/predicted hydrocarbon binding protein
MKAKDLHLNDLLHCLPDSGIISLLDHRVLIFDSMALGLLLKELIDSMGQHAARAILSRFGYAHGWRTAESLKKDWPDLIFNDSSTGPRLHTMQGLLTHLSLDRTTDSEGKLRIIATWKDSYEVEQHRLHFGETTEPVCWTITAFASGYVSSRMGKEVLFIEQECGAMGDPVCRVEGRLREDWEAEFNKDLCYYNPGTIDNLLPEVNQKLKSLEKQLQRRKRQIARLENEAHYDLLCARSPSMRKLIDFSERISKVDSTVVISGESGVGKEKIARFIHEQSARANHPFIAINCGALTESLLESELFGYAKGAFTGATTERAGLFEAACGGTLFLDEIGEIPFSMQVKLLRALQEREIRRIGESRSRAIDIRVLSATNRNLMEEVTAGRFRQDLYYRLRVIELKVPPVRERTEDIIPLARLFLDEIALRSGRKALTFGPDVAKRMLQYDWPGNVREIQNAIEYTFALTLSNHIEVEDLPEELLSLRLKTDAHGIRSLKTVEKEYIYSVLEMMDGNKSKTAKALKIGLATLYRKLADS